MKYKELFKSLKNDKEWTQFYEAIQAQKKINVTKSKNDDLIEGLQELSTHDRSILWETILEKFIQLFDEYENEAESDEIKLEKLCLLTKFGIFQINVLLSEKKPIYPEKFVQFVVGVGSILDEIKTYQELHREILSIAEIWCLNRLDNFEEIIEPTIKHLLLKCLEPNSKKSDIEKLYNVQKGTDVLLKLSKEEPSLKIIISCVEKSSFIRSDYGTKLLSDIFTLEDVINPFHDALKQNFADITNSDASKFADVYFRSFKKSTPEIREQIKKKIQDMMYIGMLIESPRIEHNIHTFLQFFHKLKKHPPYATMIYNLYEPFLWRHLRVANGFVRTRATKLFLDLFPCVDVGLTKVEQDDLNERQYQIITELLVDPCHLVRIAALKGLFPILNDYWLIFPSTSIQKIFDILINQLLLDASSAEVRTLVVQGIESLLDSADAMYFVGDILPHVSPAFDDVSTAVRIAVVRLLIKVKATRFIKFWKLVPMEHLINRLAVDVQNVQKFISELIFSTYLPVHANEQEKLERCIQLIQTNRQAVRPFLQNVHKKIDIENTMKFLACIWVVLFKYVDKNVKKSQLNKSDSSFSDENQLGENRNVKNANKRKKRSNSVNKENEDNGNDPQKEGVYPLDDPKIVGGILDILVYLLIRLKSRIKSGDVDTLNKMKKLKDTISNLFGRIWNFFKEDTEISQILLYLASLLPRSKLPVMPRWCLNNIKDLTELKDSDFSNQNAKDQLFTSVAALCNWGRYDDLIDLASDWIKAAFQSPDRYEDYQKKAPRKGGKVCFEVLAKNPKPMNALHVLDYILSNPINKTGLLAQHSKLMVQVANKMAHVQQKIKIRLVSHEEISPLCSDEFLTKCFADYLTIVTILHVHFKNKAKNDEIEVKNGENKAKNLELEDLNDVQGQDHSSKSQNDTEIGRKDTEIGQKAVENEQEPTNHEQELMKNDQNPAKNGQKDFESDKNRGREDQNMLIPDQQEHDKNASDITGTTILTEPELGENVKQISMGSVNAIEIFDSVLQWIAAFVENAFSNNSEIDDKMLINICEKFLIGSCDLISVGVAEGRFIFDLLNFGESLLKAPLVPELLKAIFRTISTCHNYLYVFYSNEKSHFAGASSKSAQTLVSVLKALARSNEQLLVLEPFEIQKLSEFMSLTFDKLIRDSDSNLEFLTRESLLIMIDFIASEIEESKNKTKESKNKNEENKTKNEESKNKNEENKTKNEESKNKNEENKTKNEENETKNPITNEQIGIQPEENKSKKDTLEFSIETEKLYGHRLTDLKGFLKIALNTHLKRTKTSEMLIRLLSIRFKNERNVQLILPAVVLLSIFIKCPGKFSRHLLKESYNCVNNYMENVATPQTPQVPDAMSYKNLAIFHEIQDKLNDMGKSF